MYKLRALGEVMSWEIFCHPVADGNYYFHKARYFRRKNIQTLWTIFNAESYPSEFLDKRILGQEVQLYRSSLTAIFEMILLQKTSSGTSVMGQLIELTLRQRVCITKEASGKAESSGRASWRGIE